MEKFWSGAKGAAIGLAIGILVVLLGHLARAESLVSVGFGPSLDGSTQPHALNVEVEHDWGQFALVGNFDTFWESPMLYAGSIVPSAKVVTADGLFLRCGVGVGLVSRTDERLSSPYEFNIVCAGGLTTGRVEMGPEFRHWSDGAPVLGPGPNLGRDLASIRIGVKF